MEKNKLANILLGVLAIGLLFTSCKKDEEEPIKETFNVPTIKLSSPVIPSEGLTPEVGTTVSFVVIVHADAGLSEITANDKRVKIYTGTETDDTASYDLLIEKEDLISLVFTVNDAEGHATSVSAIAINPVPGEDLGLLIVDFAGESSANVFDSITEWDQRTTFTFDVTGGVTNKADIQIANDEATLTFAATNPDGNGKVLKLVKIPPADFPGNSWSPTGGWIHGLIDLNSAITQAAVEGVRDSTKVIKLDVYYDATVTQAYVMDSITTLETRYPVDIWNADASLGYKIDLILANSTKHLADYDNNGYFFSQVAYFTEENQWVTLTFTMLDEGRSSKFIGAAAVDPATSGEVDMIHIITSPGYEEATGGVYNENPIYFKNLRIVDVE